MTRSELKELGIEEKTTIDAIMNLYGVGINTAKEELVKLQQAMDEKDKSISELTEKAKNLDGTESTLKDLQDKVASYEKAETDRIELEKQTKLNGELRERFNTIKGESKFTHDLVENGRFEEFKKALSDERFKGKGDSDIFQAVIKPEDLANPQQVKVTMPAGGSTIPSDLTKARNYEEYKAMRKGAN